MRRQKFHTGDRIRIAEEMPIHLKHFPHDREATVLYSFADKYGRQDEHEYALDVDKRGYVSWYPEDVLTLVKRANIPAKYRKLMKGML